MGQVKIRLSPLWISILILAAGVTRGFALESATQNALLLGHWQEFLQMFGEENATSGDPVARHLIAHAYAATGRTLMADSLFGSMARQDTRRWLNWTDSLTIEYPSNHVAAYLSADAQFRMGRWAESITAYSRALRMMRDFYALVSRARGIAWAEKNRDSAAIADLSLWLEAHPDDAMAHYHRGRSYAGAGRFDEAILDFDTSLRLNRKFLLARYYKAVALDEAGRIEDAKEVYQSFIDSALPEDSAYIALAEQHVEDLELAAAQTADSLWEASAVNMAVEIDSVEFIVPAEDVSACDVMPSPKSVPESEYPEEAKDSNITGVVELRILVNEKGEVINAMVNEESGVDSSLIEAAKEAAVEGEWEPGLDNDEPSPCWVEYAVEFAADGEVRNRLPEVDASAEEGDTVVNREDPKPVFIPEPKYPDSAMNAEITGVVQLRVSIDEGGQVGDAIVTEESSEDVGFEEAAMVAAKKGKWVPAMENGEPVSCLVLYKVAFTTDMAERQLEAAAASEPAVDSTVIAMGDSSTADIDTTGSAGPVPEPASSEESPAPEDDSTAEVQEKVPEVKDTGGEFAEEKQGHSSIAQMPEPLDVPEAEFPELAEDAGLAGTVTVKVLVNRDGTVRKASVESDSGTYAGFRKAAEEAALNGKWKPAIRRGNPVPFQMRYQVEFTADGDVINHFEEESEEKPPTVTGPEDAAPEDSALTAKPGEERPAGPDSLAGKERQPIAVLLPDPEYPEEAAKDKIEGDVWIRVLVDTVGKVTDAIVDSVSVEGAGFEKAAITAALKGKWNPAEQNGRPVESWVSYKISFPPK
jgi:TonB family protein